MSAFGLPLVASPQTQGLNTACIKADVSPSLRSVLEECGLGHLEGEVAKIIGVQDIIAGPYTRILLHQLSGKAPAAVKMPWFDSEVLGVGQSGAIAPELVRNAVVKQLGRLAEIHGTFLSEFAGIKTAPKDRRGLLLKACEAYSKTCAKHNLRHPGEKGEIDFAKGMGTGGIDCDLSSIHFIQEAASVGLGLEAVVLLPEKGKVSYIDTLKSEDGTVTIISYVVNHVLASMADENGKRVFVETTDLLAGSRIEKMKLEMQKAEKYVQNLEREIAGLENDLEGVQALRERQRVEWAREDSISAENAREMRGEHLKRKHELEKQAREIEREIRRNPEIEKAHKAYQEGNLARAGDGSWYDKRTRRVVNKAWVNDFENLGKMQAEIMVLKYKIFSPRRRSLGVRAQRGRSLDKEIIELRMELNTDLMELKRRILGDTLAWEEKSVVLSTKRRDLKNARETIARLEKEIKGTVRGDLSMWANDFVKWRVVEDLVGFSIGNEKKPELPYAPLRKN